MKKTVIVSVLLAATISFSGCKSKEESFPENPKDGQTYTTPNGSTGIWNAAMGYWMIRSMVNNQSVTNRFYPSTNSYTDNSGKQIAKPNYFKTSKSSSSSRSGGFGVRRSGSFS